MRLSIHGFSPRICLGRDGVALIMVLGLLSMMLVLAVAFTSMSRIERAASSNYTRNIQAELRVDAAIWDAMDHMVSNYFDTANGIKVYPDIQEGRVWSFSDSRPRIMVSTGNPPTDPSDNTDDDPSASEIAPSGVWEKLSFPDKMMINPNLSAKQWITIGTGQAVTGRYCYIAGNMSGLADINSVNADAVDIRDNGITPDEIWFEGLEYLVDSGQQLALSTELDNRVYLHDWWEIRQFAEDYINAPNNGYPEGFYVYSRNPPGGLDGNGNVITNPAVVSLDVANISESEIYDAFGRMFSEDLAVTQPALFADRATDNLLDYIDADHVPRDLESPATEAVPMINEFNLEATWASSDGGTNELEDVKVELELFYPFVKLQPEAVELQVSGVLQLRAGGTPTIRPFSFQSTGNIQGMDESDDYRTFELTNAASLVVTGTPGQATIYLDLLSISGQVVLASSPAAVVDRVETEPVTFTNLTLDLTSVGSGNNISLECVDPRFNWEMTNDIYWAATTLGDNSLNNSNLVLSSFKGVANNKADVGEEMYVKNAPIESVGELGYLCFGVWKTLRLVKYGNRDPHPVFDFFTTTTNAAQFGRINPNSEYTNVLASIFNDMPLKLHPEETRGNAFHTVAADTSLRMAQIIWDEVRANGKFSSMYDLQSLESLYEGGYGIMPGLDTDVERESILRGSSELMGLRNNLIHMVIIVQTGEDADGDGVISDDEVLSSAKAGVDVWRDAYPTIYGSQKEHTMFIRRIRHL